jgi:FtsP/CotA-like multicopper oxidase with cupredoxin domain
MSERTRKRKLQVLVLVGALLALIIPGLSAPVVSAPLLKQGMVCTDGTVMGTTRTFDVTTSDGYVYTPDGNTVYSWGYSPGAGAFQLPGPVLCARQGETVVVNLTNGLPVKTSISFPGQEGVTSIGGSSGLFTAEAGASGGTVSYSFIAGEPGTYLYESGTDPELQVEMGLYGGLVIRPMSSTGSCTAGVPAGSSYAYGAARTQFDPCRENMLILAEVDPEIHLAVERKVDLGQPVNVDLTARHNRYYFVNGRSFPDTLYDNFVPWLPNQPYGSLVRVQPIDQTGGQPSMIRYVNAGFDNHPFHPHGNHMLVIGRDGRLLQGPSGEDTSFQDFTRTVGAGQTYDMLFRWLLTCNTSGLNGQNWLKGAGTGTHTCDTAVGAESDLIPVTIPNYKNLTFKDGVTRYNGNPYLGYKGSIPSGTTSLNVCGEYYFPWHSHALNEFVNFDEGFGGMATLVRVDPPPSLNHTGKSCK